jgi:hypothetical protein
MISLLPKHSPTHACGQRLKKSKGRACDVGALMAIVVSAVTVGAATGARHGALPGSPLGTLFERA